MHALLVARQAGSSGFPAGSNEPPARSMEPPARSSGFPASSNALRMQRPKGLLPRIASRRHDKRDRIPMLEFALTL